MADGCHIEKLKNVISGLRFDQSTRNIIR